MTNYQERLPLFAQQTAQAGELVCSNCAEPWPGHYTGFWLRRNGAWYHWCSGGRPGVWHVAIVKGGSDDAEMV